MKPRMPFALVFALAACEQSPPRPAPPPREPRPPPVAFRREDAGFTGTEEPPTAALEDSGPRALPEIVTRCVARNRRDLPAELSAALGVLDAPTLLEDACRLDAAPRLGSPALCEGITSSTLRETCAFRAAIATAAPDRCPRTPGLLGREPVCVAVAARDPGLCAAVPGTDRGRCLALVHADARLCETADPIFRAACARDMAALGPWLSPRRGDPQAEATVTVDLIDPAADAAAIQSWTLRGHRRGAWLDTAGALWIVDPAIGWPRPTAAAGDEPITALRVPTSGITPGAEIAAEARVMLPDALALDTADGTARATATLSVIPGRRGERYALTVHVEGARAGMARALTIRAEGFVRDVVPAAMLR